MILLFSVGQSRTCTPESKADMNPQFDTTVPCIRDGASEYERARKFPTQNARKMAVLQAFCMAHCHLHA